MTTQMFFPSVQTRADQMLDKFIKFHRENPRIWSLFQRFTSEMWSRGFRRYSARGIWHRIRWEVSFETREEGTLKMSNDHTPYYARMWLATHPQAGPFFKVKKLTSQDRPALKGNPGPFLTGGPENEDELMERLKALGEESP